MPTIAKNSEDQSIDVFIEDSSSTTGAGLTGLAHNESGLTCYYKRGAVNAPAALSLTEITAYDDAHQDGGWWELDDTNMPGLYRLDLSDAIVETGEDYVTIYLRGATNMAPCVVRIELVDSFTVGSDGKGLISDDEKTSPGSLLPVAVHEAGESSNTNAAQAAAANALADYTLRRNTANARAAAMNGLDAVAFRSAIGAFSRLHNKVTRTGAAPNEDLTVYREDDTTSFQVISLTVSASVDPIITTDPD